MVFITDEHDLLKINNSGKYGYAYQKSSTPIPRSHFVLFEIFSKKYFLSTKFIVYSCNVKVTENSSYKV